MDYLVKLDQEEDYDSMCKLMVTPDGMEEVSLVFPGYNVKVLISAFMVKNFPDVYTDEELQSSAKSITRCMLEINHEEISKIYQKYFKCFSEWRKNDIEVLKVSLELQKATFHDMIENDPADEADEQWNDGIQINMQTLDTHIDKLDVYSKTPPKS